MPTNETELLAIIEDLKRENALLQDENTLLAEQVERLQKTKKKKKGISLFMDEEEEESIKIKCATVMYVTIEPADKLKGSVIPAEALDHLDEILLEFNHICTRHCIERIKTLGHSLLCAGGIECQNATNPIEVVQAGLDFRLFFSDYQKENNIEGVWVMKMGIHTGSLHAFPRGTKKLTYELKGDTVSAASRIESIAVQNSIVISANTYELVKEFFECQYYGNVPIKYIGEIDLYEIIGILPELSLQNAAFTPNSLYQTRISHLRYSELQEYVLDMLERELPTNLFYHNIKHTIDVVTGVELIGWAEKVNEDEMLLLKTAALLHDSGHIHSYKNHEEESVRLAEELLPSFGYNDLQINQICKLIMATQLPPNPQDLLEEIICDSDLDYLGRKDYIPISQSLYEEFAHRSFISSEEEWNKLQIEFITNHQYFTKTAQRIREVNKQKQIERIKQLLEMSGL